MNQSQPERSDWELLAEADEFKSLTEHSAWPKLVVWMQGLVDEALNDVRQCRSSDERVRSQLVFCWQQREQMLTAMLHYVESFRTTAIQIREEIEHERESATAEPFGYTSAITRD